MIINLVELNYGQGTELLHTSTIVESMSCWNLSTSFYAARDVSTRSKSSNRTQELQILKGLIISSKISLSWQNGEPVKFTRSRVSEQIWTLSIHSSRLRERKSVFVTTFSRNTASSLSLVSLFSRSDKRRLSSYLLNSVHSSQCLSLWAKIKLLWTSIVRTQPRS